MEFPKNDDDMIISYKNLRRVIGILGISLPFMVVLGGFIHSFVLQGSISLYYYTNAREIFVGILSSVALFLLTYKGIEKLDDIITNLSGIFAIGIVIFPTEMASSTRSQVGLFLINDSVSMYIHLTFAALFFIALAFNAIFLFTKSGDTQTPEKLKRNVVYRVCGIVILISLLSILIFFMFLQGTSIAKYEPVLILETISLIAFGTSWLIKGETLLMDK